MENTFQQSKTENGARLVLSFDQISEYDRIRPNLTETDQMATSRLCLSSPLVVDLRGGKHTYEGSPPSSLCKGSQPNGWTVGAPSDQGVSYKPNQTKPNRPNATKSDRFQPNPRNWLVPTKSDQVGQNLTEYKPTSNGRIRWGEPLGHINIISYQMGNLDY